MLTYGYDSNSGMEKTASEMMKDAEVRGVVAAFCDAGLVKVASAEAFDDLTEKVAYCLNDYYTVDDVADATSYVIKLAENQLPAIVPPAAGGEGASGAEASRIKELLKNIADWYSLEGIKNAKGFGPTALEALKYGGKVAAPVAGLAGLGYGGKALYDYLSD